MPASSCCPSGVIATVLTVALSMLFILLLAGLVLVYVTFPHRGASVPHATWVGTAMRRAVDAAPVLPADQRLDVAHDASVLRRG